MGHSPLPFPGGSRTPFSSAQTSGAPRPPVHPSRHIQPPPEWRPPLTFSWALLNFFCICLAKTPAAPPALPSAILWVPRGRGPWRPRQEPCGFLEAAEEEVQLPACLAPSPGGGAPTSPRPRPLRGRRRARRLGRARPNSGAARNPGAASLGRFSGRPEAGPPRGPPRGPLEPSSTDP